MSNFEPKLLLPVNVSKNNYYVNYDKKEIESFFNNINFYTSPITKYETLYLQSKVISQDKLREAGFSITRSKDKADIIVISDPLERNINLYRYTDNFSIRSHKDIITPFLQEMSEDEPKNYKYIWASDLYKYIYKYDGNKDLYNNIVELLGSKDSNNIKMAMEFMTNANWENEELYLAEIFYNYEYQIFQNDYKNSISFKGFIKSLDFNPQTLYLSRPDSYRHLCKKDEHHDFVYNKFKQQLEEELEDVIKKYKIKIDKLEYSIDKTFNEEEE